MDKRIDELEISQFKNINELYSFIDYNAFDFVYNWNITDLWVKYRDWTSSEDEKQKAQYEIDCFIFNLSGGQLFSQIYSSSNEKGEINKYPDEFQTSAIEYVKKRSEDCSSSILKARYFHLLWKSSPKIKNNQHAAGAIENYIYAIYKLCELFKKGGGDKVSSLIGRTYENLVAISDQVKMDTSNLIELTSYLLFDVSEFKFYTKHGILTDMLEHPKLFKCISYKGAIQLFEKEHDVEKEVKDNFDWANYYLPTVIKIATKLQSDVKKWQNERGFCYLRMANNEVEEDRFWIKQDYHSSAIEAFRLAGNDEKRLEVEYLYSELKPKVKLHSFRYVFEEDVQKKLKDYYNYIKEKAAVILQLPSHEVYGAIASGFLFPKRSDIVKSKENVTNNSFDHLTTISFDRNKNITNQDIISKDVKKIYEMYDAHIDDSVLPYLYNIFIPGIKSGHLTFQNFLEFFVENSWIGKPHNKYDLGGEVKPIDWIKLLAPAIVEFFMQIQGSVSSKYYEPNFILCTDSLTLKMEGLFRDFCDRSGIPISFNRKKGMQEIYINNVFENEIIKKYFNEDDLLFFNYLFSNDGGLNLRNNIAHCFYNINDYGYDKILLLIAALLRLGKYDYTVVKEVTANHHVQ